MTAAEDSAAMVVTSYFAAVNEDRFDDAAAMFAPDAVMRAPGSKPRTGAEIVAYFAAALAPYPNHRDTVLRTLESGSTVTVELRFNGTLAGGGELEFDAVNIFDLDGANRIVRLSSWYDSHRVRTQLANTSSHT